MHMFMYMCMHMFMYMCMHMCMYMCMSCKRAAATDGLLTTPLVRGYGQKRPMKSAQSETHWGGEVPSYFHRFLCASPATCVCMGAKMTARVSIR